MAGPRFYRVAGLLLELHVEGEGIGFEAPGWDRWAPFACDPGPADLRVHVQEHPEVIPEDLPGMEGPRPHVQQLSAEVHRFYRWGFDLELHVDRPATCSGRAAPPFTILDAALRLPVALLLGRESGGLLLHASAVSDAGGAVVLTGPPGAGKSTAALNRPDGTQVLSDEVVAVCFRDGRLVAASTPFGGDLEPNGGQAPVKRILCIEHGPGNRVLEMDLGSGAAEILRSAIVAVTDPGLMRGVLLAAERIAREGRMARLECLKDGSFWKGVL